MNADDPRHGTTAGYVAHRKIKEDACAACRGAATLYERRRTARHYLERGPLVIDGTGTRRRLRALVAIGWTLSDLDQHLGRKRSFCYELAGNDGPVLRNTAVEVSALYERLSMMPAQGWLADRQRRIAARNGWAPPLAWDDIDNPDEKPHEASADRDVDDVVVDRLIAGEPVESTADEKREAMRRWLADGRSERSLCLMHGWKEGRYSERDAA